MLDSQSNPQSHSQSSVKPTLAALLLLFLTAAMALVWQHNKLMWVDELLELESDSVATVRQVIHIQQHSPVNIDPAVYHVLSHGSIQIFGAQAFAVRLPSLLGFLLMQWCVFLFTRRLAGDRAATLAAAFPAMTAALYYAVEGRPYGLLLGLFGLAICLYQKATRDAERTATLASLALVLAITPNTHYFGVLLFLPLGAAELVRTVERRKLDLALVGSMLFGIVLGMAAILPFRAAAQRYREHYYNANTIDFHSLTESYYFLLVNGGFGNMMHRLSMLAIFAAAIAVLALVVRRRREWPLHEVVLVIMLAALPFFAYVIARYGTHTMEMRYTLGAVPAMAILVGMALAPVLTRRSSYLAMMGLSVCLVLLVTAARIQTEKHKSDEIRASLVLEPSMKAALLAGPDPNIYIEEGGYFLVSRYYEPDADVRDHLRGLYDEETELRTYKRDTNSLTADHLLQFSHVPTVPYKQLKASPLPHHMVMYQSVWDWTHQAFEHDGATVVPLGKAFDGDAVTVTFPRP